MLSDQERKNTWFILPNGLKINLMGEWKDVSGASIGKPNTLDCASEVSMLTLSVCWVKDPHEQEKNLRRITELRHG